MWRSLIGWLLGRLRPAEATDPWGVEERRQRRVESERRRAADAKTPCADPETSVVDDTEVHEYPAPGRVRADAESVDAATPDPPPDPEGKDTQLSDTDARALRGIEVLAKIFNWVEDGQNRNRPEPPDPLSFEEAKLLTGLLREVTQDAGWSPAAEQRARTEIDAFSAEPDGRDLRTRIDELAEQVDRLQATTDAASPTPGLLGSAMRIAAGVFVGAVLAGPLCAVISPHLSVWLSEPLKAAIGGGVGAFAAEATKPVDRWMSSRKEVEDIETAPTRSPSTLPGEQVGTKPLDQPGSTPLAEPARSRYDLAGTAGSGNEEPSASKSHMPSSATPPPTPVSAADEITNSPNWSLADFIDQFDPKNKPTPEVDGATGPPRPDEVPPAQGHMRSPDEKTSGYFNPGKVDDNPGKNVDSVGGMGAI